MIKKIYFVGIKGVGMASLAVIAQEAGMEVRGSDVDSHFITDIELQKITIDTGFETSAIENFVGATSPEDTLVIVTAAHGGFENPQVVYAKELGIHVVSHGQAVGMFMDGGIFNREFIGISVAGAHGKTTTSALLATTLKSLERDPSYTIGTSEIFPLGFGGHYGTSDYFIAEADEYFSELKQDRKPKFLYQNPVYLIINNIDFDHPDVYKNFDEVKYAYKQFANTDSIKTVFIHDDPKTLGIVPLIDKEVVIFGEGKSCTYRLANFQEIGLGSSFEIFQQDIPLGQFRLSVPGKHNALNATGVIALLLEIGLHPDDLVSALPKFLGTKRRLEKVGELRNHAVIYDDYAHHPTEIETSLKALKLAYPGKKITTVFQPHTFSRTQSLINEFGKAFENSDELIVLPIFPSAREIFPESEQSAITAQLQDKLAFAQFLETPDSVIKYLGDRIDSDSIVVTMGAGDVYKIGQQLKQS